jgi:hypothetical protein
MLCLLLFSRKLVQVCCPQVAVVSLMLLVSVAFQDHTGAFLAPRGDDVVFFLW